MLSLVDRDDRSCAEIDRIARKHPSEVFQCIERLDALKRIESGCSGGRATECRIVEALSRHAWRSAPFRDDPRG